MNFSNLVQLIPNFVQNQQKFVDNGSPIVLEINFRHVLSLQKWMIIAIAWNGLLLVIRKIIKIIIVFNNVVYKIKNIYNKMNCILSYSQNLKSFNKLMEIIINFRILF